MTSLRAEIKELKDQLQAKENELSTVQVQLRDCKSSFKTFQVRLSSVLAIVQIAI